MNGFSVIFQLIFEHLRTPMLPSNVQGWRGLGCRPRSSLGSGRQRWDFERERKIEELLEENAQ
jgi:hypothetical protein